MVTYKSVKNDADVITYILGADAALLSLGYTEHGIVHVNKVAKDAKDILASLEYSERDIELARIAALLHDVGNMINRIDHEQSGALIAFRLLDRMGMPAEEISKIVSAIGNHDEGTGVPVNPIAAALILGDKSDVRRSRVRNTDDTTFDIHDRVNYSATSSRLTVLKEEKKVLLEIELDTQYSSVMEFFEIFLERMMMCRRAAAALGLDFSLIINGHKMA